MTEPIINRFGDIVAVRYGDNEGLWDPQAPIRIAAFVLGFNVEEHTTALNERAFDVVHPIREFWRPELEVADIEVSDQKAGVKIIVGLGDWVGRTKNGHLRAFTNNKIVEGSFPLSHEKPPLSFERELETLINKHSKENDSNTPDYILANYLSGVLNVFNITVNARDKWQGKA